MQGRTIRLIALMGKNILWLVLWIVSGLCVGTAVAFSIRYLQSVLDPVSGLAVGMGTLMTVIIIGLAYMKSKDDLERIELEEDRTARRLFADHTYYPSDHHRV